MKRILAFLVLAIAPLASAQSLKLAVFDRLKEKASDSSELNLSKDLLGLGASFLGADKGSDAAKIKKLAEGLNNIVIRSLEFEKAGSYSSVDVKELIAELAGPGRTLVISADETKKGQKGPEISRVWVRSGSGAEVGGLRIMSAEPKELSVIEIVGKVRLEDLKDLGDLGIPNLGDLNHNNKKNDE